MHTIKFLAKYIKQYKKDTFLTWSFVLIESVLEVLIAYIMQFLLTAVKNGQLGGINGVYMFSGIIAIMALVATGAGIGAGYFASSAAAGFSKNLREAMFVKIQEYSFKNIDKFSTSSIVTRTTTDVTNVQNAFMMIIRMVLRAPFMMIFSLIMCFVTEWQLAWIFLIIIPVVLFFLLFIAKKVHPIFEKIFNTYDQLNASVEENVDGIRVVKSFNRANEQISHFENVSSTIKKGFIRAEKILSFNNPIMNLAVYAAMIAISILGANLITSSKGSDLSSEALSTLFTYIMMILVSLMMMSLVYVMIIIAKNSAERIVEILQEEPDITSKENPLMEVTSSQVDFNNVSFAYNPPKNVLTNIDIHIPEGSMVGIIGPTGSSKTTLISLIARLYDVSEGSVQIGGHDVKDYDLKVLRDSVSVVLQKNTLFSGTIRDNLKWGNLNASDKEIWEACDVAQASEFLKTFKLGLDTPLDQGGTNVSGGQKQRLCIARALLKHPKILILDDSTSACDTHTDALIREALQNNHKEITKFIIAQRVLSIKDCQIIIVLDQGKIIGMGTNDELMNNCPMYKELYESQLGGGDFDEAN